MITGKSDDRAWYAINIGIRNFNMQNYTKKILIIVNHGKKLDIQQDNIIQYTFPKNNMTLGTLRNYSLEKVPYNGIYCIWDDDDFRPHNYLSIMHHALKYNNVDAVFIKNRTEFNLVSGFSFTSRFENGTTHIFARKLDVLKYNNVDTLEDTDLQKDLIKYKKKYITLDNSPQMYIRIIHGNNTSPYAVTDRNKITNYDKSSTYKEFDISTVDKEYVNNIIKTYYNINEL